MNNITNIFKSEPVNLSIRQERKPGKHRTKIGRAQYSKVEGNPELQIFSEFPWSQSKKKKNHLWNLHSMKDTNKLTTKSPRTQFKVLLSHILVPGNFTRALKKSRKSQEQEGGPWIIDWGITGLNKVRQISLLQGFAEIVMCLLQISKGQYNAPYLYSQGVLVLMKCLNFGNCPYRWMHNHYCNFTITIVRQVRPLLFTQRSPFFAFLWRNKNKVRIFPSFLLIWVAGFILGNAFLAIIKNYTVGHFKTLQWTFPIPLFVICTFLEIGRIYNSFFFF